MPHPARGEDAFVFSVLRIAVIIALVACPAIGVPAPVSVDPEPVGDADFAIAPALRSVVRAAPLRPTLEEPEVSATWIGTPVWMSGVNWGGDAFGGSISRGTSFFGSSVDPADYVPVEIRFPSQPQDQTWCQTFLRPGYAANGIGSFPGSAWDVSDPAEPRRLNVCFIEWDDLSGPNPPPDHIWNPNGDRGLLGKREYLFIMNSDYDGSGKTYAGINIFADHPDVLYAWWPIVAPGRSFFESEQATLAITPHYVKNLYAVPDTSELILGWVYAGGDAASFGVFRGSTSPAEVLLDIVDGDTRHYTESGLTTGVASYYRIEAYDGQGSLIGTSREIAAAPRSVRHGVTLRGLWHGRGSYGDCWGYTDTATGIEYALLCARNEGVSIIDVTADPPQEVGFIPSLEPGRDAKDVKVYRHYAIVIKEQEPLQIVDISDPFHPLNVTTVAPGGGGAHNCLVEGDYLYVMGNHETGGLEIFDLSVLPATPPEVGSFHPFYYHDIDIRNDTLYACGINGDGVDIIDVSDKSDPRRIARFNYPGSGAHNAALTPDGRYVFIGDEVGSQGNHVRVFDVSDVGNVTKVADLIVDPAAVVHNCYAADTLLFIAHYTEGLRVWSVADPAAPYELAHFDTFLPDGYGYRGAWNVYPYFGSGKVIVSDMQTGLYVLEVDGWEGTAPCQCFADPCCDGLLNMIDIVETVNVTFRGKAAIPDPKNSCPYVTHDVNCDGMTDVSDVVALIRVALRGHDRATVFCSPSSD